MINVNMFESRSKIATSKMHSRPSPVAQASVRSRVMVLVDALYNVNCIICGSSVFILLYIISVRSSFAIILTRKR